MEPMEAVMALILTVLLLVIVISPATWSSAPSSSERVREGAQDGHPSSCIASSLEFVFSPSPGCSPYSLFEEENASCNSSSTFLASDNAIAGDACSGPEPVPVGDFPEPPSCAPESG